MVFIRFLSSVQVPPELGVHEGRSRARRFNLLRIVNLVMVTEVTNVQVPFEEIAEHFKSDGIDLGWIAIELLEVIDDRAGKIVEAVGSTCDCGTRRRAASHGVQKTSGPKLAAPTISRPAFLRSLDYRPMNSHFKRTIGSAVILSLALAGCASGPWRGTSGGDERWGALGCDTETGSFEQRGRLERATPSGRGKSFSGEVLILPNGDWWVLSYGHTEQFEPWVDHDVIVEGYLCTKQGQALLASHFHVQRIRFAGH